MTSFSLTEERVQKKKKLNSWKTMLMRVLLHNPRDENFSLKMTPLLMRDPI